MIVTTNQASSLIRQAASFLHNGVVAATAAALRHARLFLFARCRYAKIPFSLIIKGV